MTGRALKWIAAITMVIDHFSVVCLGSLMEGVPDLSIPSLYAGAVSGDGQQALLYWLALIFRCIGRISFPIFCFLLTEGFCHTKNLKKYMGRLALFALISEIPFDFAIFGHLNFQLQNTFFVLLIGLMVLYGIDAAKRRGSGTNLPFLLTPLIVLAGCSVSVLLNTDYSVLGVLLISAFYLLRDSKFERTIFSALLCLSEYTAVFASLPIWFYNGRPGKSRFRYFFYWFYPVHLLILGGIRGLIGG